ncbi:MAG TPA: hypothetical protein GX404_04640 [Syntrophomonadaceae bacterium]|nr:hypothetical protein [Syntrophomonadaceae bacterium]
MKRSSTTLFLLTFFLSIAFLSNCLDRMERHFFGVKEGVLLHGVPVAGLTEEELYDLVQEMALRYQRLPVEPSLDKQSGEVVPGRPGVFIDVQKTIANTLAAAPFTEVQLVRIETPTCYKTDDLKAANQVLGSYSTYLQGSAARINNIHTAARAINHTIVWPDEIFSFNDTTGPRTAEQGYLPAPIILQGGLNMGLGGGVCQVSSTLYNAVLQAGLTIVERHPHSRPVGYVPTGKDAAVDYGYLDMKFKNNRQGPVIIKMSVYGGKIQAQILGGE